jgi:hypothetical protein
VNLAGKSGLEPVPPPDVGASGVKWAGFAPFFGSHFVTTGPKVWVAQVDIPNIEWGLASVQAHG